MGSRGAPAFGAVFVLFVLLVLCFHTPAAAEWKQPPREVLDVLNAPELPQAQLSPSGDNLALLRPLRYPPLADLARPMLRLAGVRVDPGNNGRAGEGAWTSLSLQPVAGGTERAVALPADARIVRFIRSADGRRFALLNRTDREIELWVGSSDSGQASRVTGLAVNPVLSSEIAWMPDQKTLLVKRVPPDRGAPPAPDAVPRGPDEEETAGLSASSTYEARDVLTSAEDEALFEYYAASQLVLVDADQGTVTPVGEPGLFAEVEPSPDGRRILVERLHGPWSHALAWSRFGRTVEIRNLDGAIEHVLADLPLADQVPIHGVALGPRDYSWRPARPATLVWTEALDGGDPARKAPFRDRLVSLEAPFSGEPREIYRAPHRIENLWWGEKDGVLLVQENERERRWRYVRQVACDARPPRSRTLFDLSANDRYNDPGSPVMRQLPRGGWVLAGEGGTIYLAGSGASPEGDRPFLDRFSLDTRKSERLFRCSAAELERFVGWIDLKRGTFLTRRESPAEPPNYWVRTTEGEARPLTAFTDPTPWIRTIQRRIVTYARADGTPLSFTLFLPPDYREGTRLPTVLEAYPLEYSDPATAGQVSGTDREFTRITGYSSLFFLLEGYAVLANTAMPVIGDPDTAYDTFVEQLTEDAKAALAKAVELGVTDPDRVGIMGHSHGALMTATLLAHTDLFRAGIARSGAYNHTLRPFGFQSERRTLFEARDTYLRLSPLLYADSIKEPVLLIHGEADQNPGTVPLQTRKLYEAIRGTGGTARLVMLPFEQHGYQSRQAVEEVLADQIEWFDRYVKNAGKR